MAHRVRFDWDDLLFGHRACEFRLAYVEDASLVVDAEIPASNRQSLVTKNWLRKDLRFL